MKTAEFPLYPVGEAVLGGSLSDDNELPTRVQRGEEEGEIEQVLDRVIRNLHLQQSQIQFNPASEFSILGFVQWCQNLVAKP